MKLKKLLKTCLNTIDSVCILGIYKTETHICASTKDINTLDDAVMSAEVCKWSVEHIEDDGTEADDTKVELTVYVKYDDYV